MPLRRQWRRHIGKATAYIVRHDTHSLILGASSDRRRRRRRTECLPANPPARPLSSRQYCDGRSGGPARAFFETIPRARAHVCVGTYYIPSLCACYFLGPLLPGTFYIYMYRYIYKGTHSFLHFYHYYFYDYYTLRSSTHTHTHAHTVRYTAGHGVYGGPCVRVREVAISMKRLDDDHALESERAR